MFWSYLKAVLGTFLGMVLVATIVGFLCILFPRLMLTVLAVTIIWIICLLIKSSWEQNKYYIEHEKSFDDAMAKYYKTCQREAWNEAKKAFKNAWTEFRDIRSRKKTTP